jgi:hypothetical protein
MIEGYPERDRDRAAAALRAVCKSDPEFLVWLADDMRHAEQITAAIVGMLAVAPGQCAEVPEGEIL